MRQPETPWRFSIAWQGKGPEAMRLRRMKLINFRGVQEREIRLNDGVTIVEGPNETGKSSFQDALDLLFRSKDNSKAADVREAVPYGQDVGPEIEVELETGPYSLLFRKRFRKRPETVLRVLQPQPEQLVGDQAHERASAILDETLDRNLWERLRVKQDEKLNPAAVGNTPALMKMLDTLSDEGGQRVTEGGVLCQVEAEHQRYYTLRRGSESGELQAARKDADKARDDFEVARQALAELDEQIEAYERLQKEVAKLESQVVDAKFEASKRSEELKAFESVKQRVNEAQTAHAKAETAETKARGKIEVRAALRNKAEETAKILKDAEEQHAEVAAVFADLKSEYDAAERSLKAARIAEQAARANLTSAQRRLEYLDAKDQHAKLEERIGRIDELRRLIDEADAAVAANPANEDRIAKVRKADQERRESLAALKAGAPGIAIDALGSFEALVDGETEKFTVGGHRDFSVAEELRLEVPDVLRLTARPGASLADLRSALDKAEKEAEQLLQECGSDSVEEAERRARNRTKAEEDSKNAATEAKTLLGKDELSDLRAQLAGLVERMEGLSENIEDLDALDKASAEGAFEEAEASYAQAADRLQEIQSTFNGLSEPFGQEKERLRQAVNALETAREEDRNATGALTEAREKADDESLESGLTDAEEKLKNAFNDLQEKQRVLEAYDEDSIRTLATNSEQVASGLQKKLNDLREEFAGVRFLVEAGREKGLFEKVQVTQDRANACSDTLVRIEARAKGAKCLIEVLQRCRQEAYEKHRAPFRERVEKLSKLAFGKDVLVDLAEDLTITHRTMDGVTLAFHQLSGGAQEQLGLASRLAAAMLLGDDGGPLLLDDTLGHSDPDRLRGLGAMIGASSGQAQVVIFTCQPDRFSHVGGAQTLRL